MFLINLKNSEPPLKDYRFIIEKILTLHNMEKQLKKLKKNK